MDMELGRMCKRIIDYCRSRYMEDQVNAILEKKEGNRHFKSELVYYCSEEDSPENCIILGSLYLVVCSSFLSDGITFLFVEPGDREKPNSKRMFGRRCYSGY